MKMIELDALISALNKKPQGVNYMRIHDIYNAIKSVPTYDINPGERDTLLDALISLAAVDYGKARFFYSEEDDGSWYDRNDGKYITFEEMVDRAYDSIVKNIDF